MAKRRLPPLYWGNAFRSTGKNLGVLAIIIAAASVGLWILTTFSRWREQSDNAPRVRYHLDEGLRDEGRNSATSEALWRLWRLPEKERQFDNRNALHAATEAQLPESQGFPDIRTITAPYRSRIGALEQRIADLGSAGATDDEIRRLVRERDFEVDRMRLDIATMPDRQRQFITRAIDDLDGAVERVKAQKKTGKFATTIGKAADKDDPLHILFESTWYLAVVLIVLAISFCAATILKLLPYPGAAEKWSSKVEDTFVREPAPEGSKSSSAGSFLMTATVLGIGLVSTGHILREQPGSPFYGATLGDLLPSARNEAPLHTGSDAGASSHTTVSVTPPPVGVAFGLEQTFLPINAPQVFVKVDAKPGPITGLEELRAGVDKIGTQAQVTNSAVESMRTMLATDSAKTESLVSLVADAKTASQRSADNVLLAGMQIRSGIRTADYNSAERSNEESRQDAVAGTWHAWRHALFLSHYAVNPTTIAVFDSEPPEGKKDDQRDWHNDLHNALDEMLKHPLPPQYGAPFESTIIKQMANTLDVRDPNFQAARTEVRRHLPVILEVSRIAE